MSNNVGSSIIFEDENWDNLISFIKVSQYSSIFMLVDENTRIHCLSLIQEVFDQSNLSFNLVEVAAGEQSKNIITSSYIWGELTEKNADRKSLLINLGGGMITDLGGFVASTFKRGIDFINIPTSLLAIVDASIGGKCGIDFQYYKNQLGVFNEAIKTIIHPLFLKTLPQNELISGFAEVIKHALIADKSYFMQLQSLEELNESIDSKILYQSIIIKSSIVKLDPLENGERKKLNFGHTIGHAVESFYFKKGQPLPHGFAIAAGIICESYLSNHKLKLPKVEREQIEIVVRKWYDLPIITRDNIDDIISFISQDKKNINLNTQFTLLESIGSASINHKIEEDLIRKSIEYYCESL